MLRDGLRRAAEDHSGYATGELLAMSAAIDAELSARISAGRTASPEADFIWASDGLPVTRIGAKAFDNDQPLTSVTFPSGLKEAGDMAFFLAKGLTGVLHIPESVEALGVNAFTNTSCSGLVIDAGHRQTGSDSFTLPKLTFVYIREGAAPEMGAWAFQHCKKLETMIIPASVTRFDQLALQDLASLTVITPAGSAAEAFALAHFIPVETDTYELYAAQYDALCPMPE